jgi:hypothetical protein
MSSRLAQAFNVAQVVSKKTVFERVEQMANFPRQPQRMLFAELNDGF